MGVNLNLVLAMLAGALVAGALLWPTLRYETQRRCQAEERLAEARRTLATRQNDGAPYRDLFDSLLDAFPLPVIVTTRERVIVFANRAALLLVHMPPQRVFGRVLATITQDYDTTQALLEAAEANAQRERTFQRAATGATWRVIATPMRLRAGHGVPLATDATSEATHLILTIEDLTELRRLETVRSDFVAHVSHELRTPLAAMKLLAETLEGALDGDPPAARRFALRISAEISHLTRMVAELLELSRIESGKIQLYREPTEIAGLVEVVVDRMRPLAEERGVTLRAEIPAGLPDALADGERIGEVLINLMHNGIKYTEPGGTITISAEVANQSAAFSFSGARPPYNLPPLLAISVADTGIGIRAEDLSRIFERFYKADRARTRTGMDALGAGARARHMDDAQASAAAGTGLGLAIARHLVELHGGNITARSRLGQGATFTFTLPLAAPRTAAETAEPHRPPSSNHAPSIAIPAEH